MRLRPKCIRLINRLRKQIREEGALIKTNGETSLHPATIKLLRIYRLHNVRLPYFMLTPISSQASEQLPSISHTLPGLAGGSGHISDKEMVSDSE